MGTINHLQEFDHRPSAAFTLSGNTSRFMRKRIYSVTDSESRNKVLNLNDFRQDVHSTTNGFTESLDFSTEYLKNTFIDYPLSKIQLEEDHLSKFLAKECSKIYILSLNDILYNEISDEYLKFLYITLVYVIQNYFGARSPKSEEPEKLLAFTNQFIPLSSKVKYEFFKKAKKIKSPEFILNIKIIEASGFSPTDPDGLSDPFCKIWLNDDKERIKRTNVKEHTLNPMWNETFNFRIRDLRTNILHLEVWDKDPRGIAANLRQIKNVRNLRGFRLFCRDCCQNTCYCCTKDTDDFIGKADILVNEIYSEGTDDWMPLKGTEKGTVNGRIHISIDFEVIRPRNVLGALKRHLLIFKIFLQQRLKEYNSNFIISNWDQILSPAAFTLLLQHTIQSSVSPPEDLLCRFIVFVHLMQNGYSFNYKFLYSIMRETCECHQQLLSAEFGLESSLDGLFRESANKVYHACLSVISTLHSIDLTIGEEKCKEFEYVLRCISICYDISGREELPWTILKSEATLWFQQVAEEIRNKDAKIKTHFISITLTYIISYHSAADKVIKNVFPDRSYTFYTYEILDSELSECLRLHMAEIGNESITSDGDIKDTKLKEALNVFSKMKEVTEYIRKILNVLQLGLEIENFREWFGPNTLITWFSWKEELILRQIRQIVYSDSLENIFIKYSGRFEKQSLSVKLTSNLIEKELVQLWNLVSHSEYQQYDSVFLKALHICIMKYLELLLELVNSKYVISNFRMHGLSKLCVIANNLWSLGIFVQKTVTETVVHLPLDCCDTKFCLQLICRIICADISKEVELDIVNLVKKILDSNSKKRQTQALALYKNYLHNLFIEEAKSHMAFEIYVLFQKEMMAIILNILIFFKELHKDSDSKGIMQKCKQLFVKTSSIGSLLAILVETEKLCFVDDMGKIKQHIWTDGFKQLQNELQQYVIYS